MALWRDIKRVSRYGLIGFFRNGFVSLASVLIMTITLFVIATLLVSGAALQATLVGLTEKVDVNVYFITTAPEEKIADLKKSIEALPETALVTYVTREEALENFRERHKNDQLTLQALDELGDNPFGASLAIRAKETSQYESISKFLESSPASAETGDGHIIEKINFLQNKTTIDRLSDIISTSRKLGIIIALFLGIASILIAFNTIRLAIYTSRDEIGVMKLVGAEHWYVRGPFVISGVLYGFTAGMLVLIILYPLSLYLAAPSEKFFGNFNTFDYFTSHFPLLFMTVIGTGILLGATSSYLAVHRYLRK
jgi:cell division transport system permease protein